MHSQSIPVLVSVVLLLVLAAIAPAPAAADPSGSVLDAIVDESDSTLEQVQDVAAFAYGYATGAVSEALGNAPVIGDETQWSATATAADVRDGLNEHSASYESWLNDRLNATTDRDTLAVTFDNGSASATIYVIANVSNGSYEDLQAVDSTDRSADESCTITGRAGANARSELETFRERFVEPGNNASKRYMGRLAAQYPNGIDCSFR